MPGEMVYEEFPTFNRREGDVVLSGRNNAEVILGRDRMNSLESGHGGEKEAGAITMVVGRFSGDPSLHGDSATVYLSMRSSPDGELDTDGPSVPKSVVVARADRVLIVPRDELVVSVGSAELVLKSDGSITVIGNVSFGKGAAERLIKESFGTVFLSHIHPDPASGFTGKPVSPVPDSVYSNKAKSL